MPGSDPAVCVETNWIIDVAFGRDEKGSTRMMDLAQQQKLILYLPSFCISEAVKVLEDHRTDWRKFRRRLVDEQRRLTNLPRIPFDVDLLARLGADLGQLIDDATGRFWSALEDVSRQVHFVEIDEGIITGSRIIMESLKLSAGDAMVLATARTLARRGKCNVLMSKNRVDFFPDMAHPNEERRKPWLADFYNDEGITYSFEPIALLKSLGLPVVDR